jgi:hypothetical protein
MRFHHTQAGRLICTRFWGITACTLLAFLIGNGCKDRLESKGAGPGVLSPDGARAGESGGSNAPLGLALGARGGTNTPRPEQRKSPGTGTDRGFVDLVQGGAPPGLVAAACALVGDTVGTISDYKGRLYAPLRLFDVQAKQGSLIFLEKDGHYIWLGANAELMAMNEAFSRPSYRRDDPNNPLHTFRREDFNDPLRIAWLLDQIVQFHEGRNGFTVGCSMNFARLRGIIEELSDREAAARTTELFREPKFNFEGDIWKVAFNVCKPQGRVDRYDLWGRHDPNAKMNEILRLDTSVISPMNGPAHGIGVPSGFIDRVDGGSPPGLLAAARALVGNNIWVIWRSNELIFAPVTMFDVDTTRGSLTFLEKDGHYVWLGAGAELMGINEALSRLPFTRNDFNDPSRVAWFLGEVMRFHEGNNQFTIGCSVEPPGSATAFRDKESETLVKELCQDPRFDFEGDLWKVTFNVFKRNGRVDRWNLLGRHDAKANVNEILRVDISTIRAGEPTVNPLGSEPD